LGVITTRDLKSESQCKKSASKAMSVMGLSWRNFSRIDREDFNILYKGYIRPHLEYAVQAWSPHLRKDIDCLERVQRRATKLVHGLNKNSYEDRLKLLGLTTLEKRKEKR
jgi:ribonuclease P/MRP protein subunit RPP40